MVNRVSGPVQHHLRRRVGRSVAEVAAECGLPAPRTGDPLAEEILEAYVRSGYAPARRWWLR